jgi:RNase adaptor protein for sRNA GlmZ degradation
MISPSGDSETQLLIPGESVVENLNLSPPPTLRIVSWGHRRGPLLPAPLISIDLRRLPNPPKQARDKHNGTSKVLREWLFSNDVVRRRFEDACLEIRQKLSEAIEVGNRTATVGVNCELGKHRSVAFVEEMGRMEWDGWEVTIEHRDVNASRPQRIKRKGALDRISYVDD